MQVSDNARGFGKLTVRGRADSDGREQVDHAKEALLEFACTSDVRRSGHVRHLRKMLWSIEGDMISSWVAWQTVSKMKQHDYPAPEGG